MYKSKHNITNSNISEQILRCVRSLSLEIVFLICYNSWVYFYIQKYIGRFTMST